VKSPIQVLIAVADMGGKLGICEGDALWARLKRNCPPALKDSIQRHKPALIELLRLNFLVVRSDALNATLIWAPDEATKQALLAAGAEASSIYTATELAHLVNRKVTSGELPAIHAAKQRFHGRLTEPD
jgi:hypothetical protein